MVQQCPAVIPYSIKLPNELVQFESFYYYFAGHSSGQIESECDFITNQCDHPESCVRVINMV